MRKNILWIIVLLVVLYFSGLEAVEPRSHFGMPDTTDYGVSFSKPASGVGIKAHSSFLKAKIYLGGTNVDSLSLLAGEAVYIPKLCDSIYIDRSCKTSVTIIPSRDDIPVLFTPSPIRKSFSISHGHTMTAATDTYGLIEANADPYHPGDCGCFEGLNILGVGNSQARLYVKVLSAGHLVAQFLVPMQVPFETSLWRFDSLYIAKQGAVTGAGWSVSWNAKE